jgi:hypothetical protein
MGRIFFRRCRIRAAVITVLVAAPVAVALAPPVHGPGETPEERRTRIASRLELMTSRDLDLLARSEFPAAGEPPLTDAEMAEAGEVRRALAMRTEMVAPLSDDALRRRLSVLLVPLSEDQQLALDRDMERFAIESEPGYAASLRRARRILDEVTLEWHRLRLREQAGSPPTLHAASCAAEEILTRAVITHAAVRSARVVLRDDLLVDGQREAIAVVAEAVYQDHLQRRLEYDSHPAAAFDPIRALADVAEPRGMCLAGAEHAALRSALVAQLPERRAILLAAVQAEFRVYRARMDYFERFRRGLEVSIEDPETIAFRASLDAALTLQERLADINARIVASVVEHLGGELGRAYRRHFHHACWWWMAVTEPLEWEAARAAVRDAGSPPALLDAAAAGERAVLAVRERLREERETQARGFRANDSPDRRDTRELHQRFADRYLESQQVIEQAVRSLHRKAAMAAEDEPNLLPLATELAGHVATSVAARRQAAALAEAGEVPWALGIEGYRTSSGPDWSRGG